MIHVHVFMKILSCVELVRVAIVMKNPLNVSLLLKNVSLIWSHDSIASNNEDVRAGLLIYCTCTCEWRI